MIDGFCLLFLRTFNQVLDITELRISSICSIACADKNDLMFVLFDIFLLLNLGKFCTILLND
jgi:hypothetical protein